MCVYGAGLRCHELGERERREEIVNEDGSKRARMCSMGTGRMQVRWCGDKGERKG